MRGTLVAVTEDAPFFEVGYQEAAGCDPIAFENSGVHTVTAHAIGARAVHVFV